MLPTPTLLPAYLLYTLTPFYRVSFDFLKKRVAKYRVHINYRSILQYHIFTNAEQKYMMFLPFEGRMFAVLLVTTASKLPTERALNRHKT
jgi:hypothetical protein